MAQNTYNKITQDILPYAHWLYNIPGVGSRTIRQLLARMKTPDELYRLSAGQLETLLSAMPKGKELARRIEQSKQNWDLQGAYEKLAGKQIQFTCLGCPDYPDRLAQISDAPYGLYFRGKLPEQVRPSVAMIGARGCSEYGRRMAKQFGMELSMAGIQIISGMARGIDSIGQRAALDAGGYSLGVMGCGVDICYPAENRDLYDMLCSQGGVCSEYLPGIQPRSSLFPPRNRIISGLSDIVLVIEAKNRSGTLITVDMALEQGREVYALPGRVTEALSEGCNRLIQQGAGIALSPQDMILGLTGKATVQGSRQENASLLSGLTGIRAELLQNLDDNPQPLEQIKQRLLLNCSRDISLPELMDHLVRMSLEGLVRQIGNSYFMKV